MVVVALCFGASFSSIMLWGIFQQQGVGNWLRLRKNWTALSKEISLMKTWSRCPPTNKTMTASTQTRQCGDNSATQTEPWIEPYRVSLERPENGCPPKVPIQPDRTPPPKSMSGELVASDPRRLHAVMVAKSGQLSSKGLEYLCQCDILVFPFE